MKNKNDGQVQAEIEALYMEIADLKKQIDAMKKAIESL
jgi:uncharacterized protein YceH (UPF0502 family)